MKLGQISSRDSFFSLLRSIPAMSRNIENDVIWIAKLVLSILWHMRRGTGMRPAAMRFDGLLHRIDVVDPDAEVV
jgi:hypothetical protein